MEFKSLQPTQKTYKSLVSTGQPLYIPSMLQNALSAFQSGAQAQAQALTQNPIIQQGLKASEAIGQKIAKPILSTVQKASTPIVNTLTAPGSTYVAPALKNLGVAPAVAVGAGIAADFAAPGPSEFKGLQNLSTKIIEKLKGKTFVSKQFIEDLTNSADVRQPEKDLIRSMLDKFGQRVDVDRFAKATQSELLPLKSRGITPESMGDTARYESVTLPDELRGPVANYAERIYESPIKTSAGGVHFSSSGNPNYFAHTRIEDLPKEGTKPRYEIGGNAEVVPTYPKKTAEGGIRRVIELQSDLFQKGRLESEGLSKADATWPVLKKTATPKEITKWEDFQRENRVNGLTDAQKKEWDALDKALYEKALEASRAEIGRLEPYRNTWHERVIREEVKQAAKDGKTKLQFPTGETAMKIEGLGDNTVWSLDNATDAAPSELKVGKEIYRGERGLGTDEGDAWIITDVLGDGKFKAVQRDLTPQNTYEIYNRYKDANGELDVSKIKWDAADRKAVENQAETFDISGKVDTENPIYKFYEKEVGKYLKNKYNAKLVTDPQGVQWWELPVKPEAAKEPVMAFGKAQIAPLVALGGASAAGMAGFAAGMKTQSGSAQSVPPTVKP